MIAATDIPRSAAPVTVPNRWPLALAVALLGYLWLRLVLHLRVEWTVNEQYGYGWAVPVLCAFLLFRRFRTVPPNVLAEPLNSSMRGWLGGPFALFLGAILFIRWIEIANPDWRLVSWAMALCVIAVTLLFLRSGGAQLVRHFAFPVLFFLIAIPWPTGIEQPTIQGLTRAIVALTTEIMNAFGVVAVPHGNTIETASGWVDVDEGCSGIRSLQASLMLSLFFGEWHRLNAARRLALCGVAFALAFVFNLARTLFLTLVAAQQGSAAISRWHDPAGLAILVGCFLGIMLMAGYLARPALAATANDSAAPTGGPIDVRSLLSRFNLAPRWLAAMVALLVVGEAAVFAWYASARPVNPPQWRLELPVQAAGFKTFELAPAAKRILRYNESACGTWLTQDGQAWQAAYIRWNPGRVAVNLARNHTPEICLPAAGRKLTEIADVQPVPVGGITLPFRCYTTGVPGRPTFVFYSLWEDGASNERVLTRTLTWERRWRAVLERHRNPGQRALHIGVTGPSTREQAEVLLRSYLPQLIRFSPRARASNPEFLTQSRKDAKE